MSATALPHRDPSSGRFVAHSPLPCCGGCGCVLAEALAGYLYCPLPVCPDYRKPAGMAPGADPGLLAVDLAAVTA